MAITLEMFMNRNIKVYATELQIKIVHFKYEELSP